LGGLALSKTLPFAVDSGRKWLAMPDCSRDTERAMSQENVELVPERQPFQEFRPNVTALALRPRDCPARPEGHRFCFHAKGVTLREVEAAISAG
jgi:hypothetical protein